MIVGSSICAGLEHKLGEDPDKSDENCRLRAQLKEFQEAQQRKEKELVEVNKVDASCTTYGEQIHKLVKWPKVERTLKNLKKFGRMKCEK